MTVICDYCGNPAYLVTGAEIYPHRPDLKRLSFWSCSPCSAYVGCHKDSDAVPLGRLANAELRRAKNRAHAAFDPIWKEKRKSRSKAYSWLAHQLKIQPKDCHIGMFDIEMCDRVIAVCEQLKEQS
ncbi:zinc-finger-containing protein [Serratia fonticola]